MPAPFRQEDLESRVAHLREQRDALMGEVARARAEMRALRPWSYRRFLLGALLPVLGLGVMLFVSTIATFVLR